MGFLPKEYGGGNVSNLDLQIAAEEICAVDPGFATILLVNGLGLMPLAWFGSEEQKRKWIGEATSDTTREYLAGWVVSEAAETPGGYRELRSPRGSSGGYRRHCRARQGPRRICPQWQEVLAVQRWGGGISRVPTVNVVIVRTDPTKGGKEGLSAILVPRDAGGVSYEQPISKIGHRLCQNNAMTFENCRVPEENLFAEGNGDLVISKAFTWSGPVAAIAAVGVARTSLRIHPGLVQDLHGWRGQAHHSPSSRGLPDE